MLFRPAITALLLAFMITLLPVVSAALKYTQVKPYVMQGNKPVQAHKRKSPNKTKLDNYGAKGNLNPSTGKVGKNDLSSGKGEK